MGFDVSVVIYIFMAWMAVFILRVYFGIFFVEKEKELPEYALWCAYFLWQIAGVYETFLTPYVRLCISICFQLALCLICYEDTYYASRQNGDVGKKDRKQVAGVLFIKCILVLLLSVIWILMEFLTGSFFILCQLDYQEYPIAGSLISKACMAVFLISLKFFFKKEAVRQLSAGYHVAFFMIPVGSLYLVYCIFEISSRNLEKGAVRFSIIGMLILLGINLMVFKLFFEFSKEMELKRYNALYVQQLELCNRHLMEKERMMKELRKERHDRKHHISVLKSLLQKKRYQELGDYLETMKQRLSEGAEEFSKTGNLVVDAVVNDKLAAAEKEGITGKVQIHVPSDMKFEPADLGVVLGNLLDNAMEAAGKVQENRYLHLAIRYEYGQLFIVCINSFNGVLKRGESGGELLSMKAHAEHHGFGLMSVRDIAKKYHGSVVIDYTEKEFKIKVLLIENREGKHS